MQNTINNKLKANQIQNSSRGFFLTKKNNTNTKDFHLRKNTYLSPIALRATNKRRSNSTSYTAVNNKNMLKGSGGVRLVCRNSEIKRIEIKPKEAQRTRGLSQSRLESHLYKVKNTVSKNKNIFKSRAKSNWKVGRLCQKKSQISQRKSQFKCFNSLNQINVGTVQGKKSVFKISSGHKPLVKRGFMVAVGFFKSSAARNQAKTLESLGAIEDEGELREIEKLIISTPLPAEEFVQEMTEEEKTEKVYRHLPGILTVLDFHMLKNRSEIRSEKKDLYNVYKALIHRCKDLGELERSILIHSLILAKRAILYGREKHEFKPGEFYLIYCACLFLSIKYVEDVEEWYLEDFASVAKIDKGCLHEMEIIVGINMLNFNVHSGKKEMEKVGEAALKFEKKEIMKCSRFLSEFLATKDSHQEF